VFSLHWIPVQVVVSSPLHGFLPPRPYIVPRGKHRQRLDQHPNKIGHSYICTWFQFVWVRRATIKCSVL
jgi:hypothetical protein